MIHLPCFYWQGSISKKIIFLNAFKRLLNFFQSFPFCEQFIKEFLFFFEQFCFFGCYFPIASNGIACRLSCLKLISQAFIVLVCRGFLVVCIPVTIPLWVVRSTCTLAIFTHNNINTLSAFCFHLCYCVAKVFINKRSNVTLSAFHFFIGIRKVCLNNLFGKFACFFVCIRPLYKL